MASMVIAIMSTITTAATAEAMATVSVVISTLLQFPAVKMSIQNSLLL